MKLRLFLNESESGSKKVISVLPPPISNKTPYCLIFFRCILQLFRQSLASSSDEIISTLRPDVSFTFVKKNSGFITTLQASVATHR